MTTTIHRDELPGPAYWSKGPDLVVEVHDGRFPGHRHLTGTLVGAWPYFGTVEIHPAETGTYEVTKVDMLDVGDDRYLVTAADRAPYEPQLGGQERTLFGETVPDVEWEYRAQHPEYTDGVKDWAFWTTRELAEETVRRWGEGAWLERRRVAGPIERVEPLAAP